MEQSQILQLAEKISSGQIGVIPTDTIYGIVAATGNREAVEAVYRAKHRPAHKKLIILISDYTQLPAIGVQLTGLQKQACRQVWPGPVSIELESIGTQFEHLHKNTGFIAVRLPKLSWLQQLVALTGPIVATSANKSGQPISHALEEIKKQLPGLDFYVEGPVETLPSRLARINSDGEIEWLNR